MVATIFVRRMSGGTVAPRAGAAFTRRVNVSESATRVAWKTRWTCSGPGMRREDAAVLCRELVPAQDHAQPGRVHEGTARRSSTSSAKPASCSRSRCRSTSGAVAMSSSPSGRSTTRRPPRASTSQRKGSGDAGIEIAPPVHDLRPPHPGPQVQHGDVVANALEQVAVPVRSSARPPALTSASASVCSRSSASSASSVTVSSRTSRTARRLLELPDEALGNRRTVGVVGG